MNVNELDWVVLGRALRESAEDAHGATAVPNVFVAYEFLLYNPECFGFEEWPEDILTYPTIELIAAYYGLEKLSETENQLNGFECRT